MKTSNAIRRAIRSYMDHQGLSSRALAERIGVAHTTVSRWVAEAGKQSTEIQPRHWAALRPLVEKYLGGAVEVSAEQQGGLRPDR